MTRTTTERGLGWAHQKERTHLLRIHVDGTPCWWCGKPMHREAELNWDRRVLAADHSHARAQGGTQADRLLHSICNKQRQDGRNDHQRPAVTGEDVTDARGADDPLGIRLLPWP
ncbi:hypothetical protein [Prescottella equi]|uniref:hypothetical protein n=1 Tax=Rhodococcus hoagii TaxID=43767 RepID=UPI000A10EE97|nr:hypothetical protein [Prescottella equi]NKS97484.1 hypothetical protein [Prescottella equi]NKZ71850.1 hypothetical protein [Prescottella equi]ORM18329.1 hypothetical protein A5N74_12040 [Prescottella equi]